MKDFFKKIFIITLFLTSACSNFFNDLAVDIGEYDYYLAGANNIAAGIGKISIFSIDSQGSLIANNQESKTDGVMFFSMHPKSDVIYTSERSKLYSSSIDPNGKLISHNNDIATGEPVSIKIHPSGNFLYHLQSTTSSVTSYKILIDGKLSSAINTAGESNPIDMAIHPSGKFLYILNNIPTDIISIYIINPDGSLTKQSYVPFTISGSTTNISIHPDGNFLYITNQRSGGFGVEYLDILLYSINKDSGLLTYKSSTQLYVHSFASTCLMSIHPSGKFIFFTDTIDGNVLSYNILSDRSITFIDSITGITGALKYIIIHPKTNILYISDPGGDHLYQVNFNDNGSLISTKTYNSSYTSSIYGLALIRRKQN